MDYKEKVIALLNSQELSKEQKEKLEAVFPELKESEDEKIRKAIKYGLDHVFTNNTTVFEVTKKQCLAWLEKQGEQPKKHDVCDNCDQQGSCVSPCPMKLVEKQGNKSDIGISETTKKKLEDKLNKALEKETPESCNKFLDEQGEQKPADKVEPKFHEGDWAVSNLDRKARQISEVHFDEYNSYYVVDGESVNLEEYDRLHRLWTIQDAKDGDVLSDGTTIFIFKDLLSDNSVISYCDYDTDSGESDAFCPLSVNLICSKIIPATKGQRDLLSQKMHEAGYDWDAEKKELKKIEQKPAWSEEDDFIVENVRNSFGLHCGQMTDALKEQYNKFFDKVKSLRPQNRQEWTGVTQEEIDNIAQHLDNIGNTAMAEILHKIRPQNTWKPSDEQMEALESATENCAYSEYQDCLRELIGRLKKLREE